MFAEDFLLTSIWYFDIDTALLQLALYCDNSRCNWENWRSWLHPLPKWKNKLRWEDGASSERVGECTGDRDPCFALSVFRRELCICSRCAAIFLLNSNIKTAEVSPALCCWGSSQHLKRNMDCNSNQWPTQGLWRTFFFHQYVYFDLDPPCPNSFKIFSFFFWPLLLYLNQLCAKGVVTAFSNKVVICILDFPPNIFNSLSSRKDSEEQCFHSLLPF